jgi:hypothetical protein
MSQASANRRAANRVTHQLETLWDFDYEPTHREIEALYGVAKKSQWNAAQAIDWQRPIGEDGPVLNIRLMVPDDPAEIARSAAAEKELEIKLSAWRLSQILHGEQGALLVASQLVATLPDLDAKLYVSTQVVDEARHVEVFERYVKKLHRIYPVDPRLKTVLDEILASELWELKLLGMQLIVEGLAIASFADMKRYTRDRTLAEVLDYVLRDEARHVNFGFFALRRSLAQMDARTRERVEDFAFSACDRLFGRDEQTGFASMATVMDEMGRNGAAWWRHFAGTPSLRRFNHHLFTEILIPRLRKLEVISPRVEPRYRAIGLVP